MRNCIHGIVLLLSHADNCDPQSAATLNTGLQKRATFFASSAPVDMICDLHTPINNVNKLLLPSTQLSFLFELNPPAFYLQSTEVSWHAETVCAHTLMYLQATPTFKIQVLDAIMQVKRVKVSDSLRLAHLSLLQKTPAVYNCARATSRTFNIATGSFGTDIPDLFQGYKMPAQVYVLFLPTKTQIGSFDSNPRHFEVKRKIFPL